MRARQHIGAHVNNYIGAPRYNIIDVRANIYTRVYIYTRAPRYYYWRACTIILTCAPVYIDTRAPNNDIARAPNYIDVRASIFVGAPLIIYWRPRYIIVART